MYRYLLQAEDHLKETISVIDNYATRDDTVQFLVSTSDKTIHGKNRGYGFRIRQVGGHLSDESVQQLSRDISRISLPNAGNEGSNLDEIPSSSEDVVKKGPRQDHQLAHGHRTKHASGPDVDSNKATKLDDIKQNSSQKRSGSGL